MTCPVEVMQDEYELSELVKIYLELAPKRILEIGSMYGGTLWHWIQNAKPGTKIVSVDLPVVTKDRRHRKVMEARAEWPKWAEDAGVDLIAIRGNSTWKEAIERVREYAPFDFAFIDGDHYYQVARADYENYWPMIAPGGVMAFHDIDWPLGKRRGIQVIRLWRELKEEHKYHEISNPAKKNPRWGIGVIWKENHV